MTTAAAARILPGSPDVEPVRPEPGSVVVLRAIEMLVRKAGRLSGEERALVEAAVRRLGGPGCH